jgi:hypothetical protein
MLFANLVFGGRLQYGEQVGSGVAGGWFWIFRSVGNLNCRFLGSPLLRELLSNFR